MSAVQRLLAKLKLIKPPTEHVVLFSGIGNSGKTTLLYQLCLGEVVTTIPTMGNNVELLKIPVSRGQTLNIVAWDLGMGCGGGMPYLAMWTRSHLQWKDAIVYVIDASDKERFGETKEWLQSLLVDIQTAEKGRGLKRCMPILLQVIQTFVYNLISHSPTALPTSVTRRIVFLSDNFKNGSLLLLPSVSPQSSKSPLSQVLA